MSNLRRAGGTLLTGLALVGCGSATDNASRAAAGAASSGSSGEGSGGASIKGGAGNQESGQGGSAGTGSTSGSATGGADDSQGYIGVLQVIRTLTPPGSTLATASFDFVEQDAWDALPSEPCPKETYGACTVTKCPPEAEMNPNVPQPSSDRLDAGTITMTADEGSFSRVGTPTNQDHGYAFDTNGSLGGAELVTISATGGTVSAFTGKIQVPLAPLLLMPSLEGSQGAVDLPVSRTADFTFNWDARGASEQLQLAVVYPTSATGLPSLSCQFDASAGTATFQSGALSQLPVGTRIRLFGVNTAAVETPEGAVGMLAAIELISADKASYPAFVLE